LLQAVTERSIQGLGWETANEEDQFTDDVADRVAEVDLLGATMDDGAHPLSFMASFHLDELGEYFLLKLQSDWAMDNWHAETFWRNLNFFK
jgi:hypothetical protein